jgi:hypothetical protein
MSLVWSGRLTTLIVGLILLALSLLSFWSAARFVRGAKRFEGVVTFSTGSSTIIVEYEQAGHKNQILARRPIWGFFRVGNPVAILVNHSVEYDPLHPEYYQPIPVTARVASPVYLWGWAVFLSLLATPLLGLYALSVLRPGRFQVTTRLDFQ